MERDIRRSKFYAGKGKLRFEARLYPWTLNAISSFGVYIQKSPDLLV